MKRLFLSTLGMFVYVFSVSAQVVSESYSTSYSTSHCHETKNAFVKYDILNHLTVGVNVGTTGIGIDIQSPVTRYLNLRAGVDYMPRFNSSINFGLQAYKDDGSFSTDLEKMQEFMKTLSGYEVDQEVLVIGQPTMVNFKFMIDYYPWVDKGWHLTAGFYYGGSRVAKAVNSIVEMPSLLAVGIYNKFYDNALNDYYIDNPIFGNTYLSPEVVMQLREKMEAMGRMGIHMGDFHDGKPYMMEPDKDGLVKANVFVNKFKPYVGVGYNGALPKNNKFKIGFDLGVMMWGGTPRVVTHDGIDLTRDVVNVRGRVGDYVDLISAFKVYPVLNFKISYNIF